jgi:hypothetical protein
VFSIQFDSVRFIVDTGFKLIDFLLLKIVFNNPSQPPPPHHTSIVNATSQRKEFSSIEKGETNESKRLPQTNIKRDYN